MNVSQRLVPALALLVTAACATGGGGTGGAQAGDRGAVAPANQAWPIKTREHVDLWLHGYAMLTADTTAVPYFRRGYRDQMVVIKNRANTVTQLDANRDQLRQRLATSRGLVGGQFLALYFGSWDELRQAASVFLQANGDPRASREPQVQQAIALIGASFQDSGDREWLRLFVQSLDDERGKFYHNYWVQEQRARANLLPVIDSLWQKVYRPRMQRFLNNTQQPNGDLLLALPLDGEGRTIAASKTSNLVTVAFPERAADAVEVIYVFAHEAVNAIAAGAVNDNTTPNEKRSGVADRYTSAAAVQGGFLLLQRLAPELADGYARYYLRSANRATTGGSSQAALAAAFPLPAQFRDAMTRQLDVVLGGI